MHSTFTNDDLNGSPQLLVPFSLLASQARPNPLPRGRSIHGPGFRVVPNPPKLNGRRKHNPGPSSANFFFLLLLLSFFVSLLRFASPAKNSRKLKNHGLKEFRIDGPKN